MDLRVNIGKGGLVFPVGSLENLFNWSRDETAQDVAKVLTSCVENPTRPPQTESY